MLSEVWSAIGLTVIFWVIVFSVGAIGALCTFVDEHRNEIRAFVMRRYRIACIRLDAKRKLRRRRRARAERIRRAKKYERDYRRALAFCNKFIDAKYAR